MRSPAGKPASVLLVLCALAAGCGALCPGSAAARGRKPAPRRAPSGQPLVSGASAYATPSQSEGQNSGESEPESAVAGEDTLVRNGLGSPLCRMGTGELSAAAASNCRTSDFVASPAPSEDYSFDTNIDTTFGVSIDALLQDYLVRPVWIFLVWLVHATLAVLEWSYTLELLNGPLASGLGPALRAAQAQLTQPWLAAALACAAVLAAYQGIVRRRVAQTLGEAVAMLAMIAGTLFVIADPSGTIGALSQWAQEASVGSFGAIASGSSARPYRSLAQSMQELYAASVQAPWCFLEFGNVAWCDQPARLDARLERAAVRIASHLEAQAREAGSSGGAGARALTHRAELLRAARTNGAVFLALPANGPLRNSVKERSSLLYVLCGGGTDATSCRGPTAAEAEFRAGSGTLPRLAGVLMIALGLSGMLLLVGFVVVRLLEAAVVSVLFLLVAPAAALAPALGESGRRAFRGWAARLLSAVAAKLLWSVLLGALLASMRVLLSLASVGWFVQWLLSGALWWGVFMRRHELLAGAASHHWMQGARQGRLARRAEDKVEERARKVGRSALKRALPRGLRDRKKTREEQEGISRTRPGPLEKATTATADRLAASGQRRRDAANRARHGQPPDRGTARGRASSRGHSGEPTHDSPARRDQLKARLQTLGTAHAQAVADGETRRAVSLRMRRQRVKEQLAGTTGSAATSPGPARRTAAPRTDGRSKATGDPRRRTPPADPLARRDRQGRQRATGDDARAQRAGLDRDVAQRRQERDPVMADAIEVARRRRRQLGWSWSEKE